MSDTSPVVTRLFLRADIADVELVGGRAERAGRNVPVGDHVRLVLREAGDFLPVHERLTRAQLVKCQGPASEDYSGHDEKCDPRDLLEHTSCGVLRRRVIDESEPQ